MTFNAKGFQANGNIDDASFFGGFMSCKAKAGAALYAGMPMKFGSGADAGLLIPCPDGALDEAGSIAGVAEGFFWIDANGNPQEAISVLSTQVSAAGDYNHLVFAAGSGVGVKLRISPNGLYAVKAKAGLAITEAMRGRYVRVLNAATDAVIDVTDGEITPAAVVKADAIGIIVDVIRAEGPQVYGSTATASVNGWGVTANTVLIKPVNSVFGG